MKFSAAPAAASLFTQNRRLLRLITPLGDDVLLAECMRGEEALSSGYRLQVSALSLDAGIGLRTLLGRPALLEMQTALATDASRPFHGHVTQVELAGANGGFARYRLTLEPWTAFLAHSRDSRIFQDMTVFDILDAVFSPWQGRGRLAPAWRHETLDRAAYPRRSITTQYQESDWAFAQRLMQEEGLFYFYEHHADPSSATLGSHTLVIADHNSVFRPNQQPVVRYTQPGAVMREDSMDRWRYEIRLQTNAVALSSWDYRARDVRSVASAGAQGDASLTLRDGPGAYAYHDRAQGRRHADIALEALEASRRSWAGAGTVRTLAPGTTFSLDGHANAGADTFVVARVLHLAHNNLAAEVAGKAAQHLGADALADIIAGDMRNTMHAAGDSPGGPGERPLYRNRVHAIPADVPYRSPAMNEEGVQLHPRPTVHGQQTGIVVGPPGAAIHTDRDHRVKVQFHWQRGDVGHSRLAHPAPDSHAGAPGDGSGAWMRVAATLATVAGANWGSHAVPRVGQEVLIDFLEGNIDRPVVIGALYNGRGQADAPHNQVAYGAGPATGNAPAWFPGQAPGRVPGEAPGHAHAAVLSGLKSQAMTDSQGGNGAYSQLVFDDTHGQPRVALQHHAAQHTGTAELNLGHLRHQSDNQRLAPAGFGAELKTEHGVALRAARGMLLSADRRSGGQMDAQEAGSQVQSSHQLAVSLAETAARHQAVLAGEAAPDALPPLAQLAHSGQTVAAAAGFEEPLLQLSTPAGISATTPASAIFSAAQNSTVTAGHDIALVAQGQSLTTARNGISLFTHGKASLASKPNQEAGIRLHAASGTVSAQSQSGATRLTADQAVTVASTTQSVQVTAKQHVLLAAQGASLKLEGGNIELHGPGTIAFNASSKELSGPLRTAIALPSFPKCQLHIDESSKPVFSQRINAAALLGPLNLTGLPYQIWEKDKPVMLTAGEFDVDGMSARLFTDDIRNISVIVGDASWEIILPDDSAQPSKKGDGYAE